MSKSESSTYQVTDFAGTVHLRTSDGNVVCTGKHECWSDAITVALRLGLVARCQECGDRAPGLLYHVLREMDAS